jgi:hypothetical protein
MKIALLLTGHFIRRQGDSTGFCVKEYCYPTLKKFLLDKHDVDVYISTWDHNYLHNGNVHSQRVDPSVVLNLFKPVRSYIRDYHTYYSEKKIIQFDNNPVTVNVNHQPLTLPKCECNHVNRDCKTVGCTAIETNADSWSLVKEGYNLIDNPSQYDYIVRTRFDLAFNNLVLDENLPKGTIVVPPWKKDSVWDDFARGDGATAYGDPESMAKYCHFIDEYPSLCNKNIPSANIHYTIGYYLNFNCGITQREDSSITYTFLKD